MADHDALWVHDSKRSQVKDLLKGYIREPKDSDPDESDWRTFKAHNGRLIVPNEPESYKLCYGSFAWEEHPEFEGVRLGRLKT